MGLKSLESVAKYFVNNLEDVAKIYQRVIKSVLLKILKRV